MAIDIVARALAVSGKQNLENYYTKNESDGRYVKSVSNKRIVYANGETGEQAIFSYNANPTAWTFPIYNGDAQLNTTDPTSDSNCVNKRYGENNYYRVLGGTNLSENADLDNYTAPATYQVLTDAIGGTIKNSPYPYAFKLIVENFSHYTLQRLQGQNPDNLWQRTRQGGAWGDWTQIATTNYVDNKTAVLIDNSLLGA